MMVGGLVFIEIEEQHHDAMKGSGLEIDEIMSILK